MAAATDATANQTKTPGDGKVKADAKIGDQTKTGDDAKSAGDKKTADGATPVVVAVNPANDPNQTIAPVAVVVAAPAQSVANPAAPGNVPQTTPIGSAKAAAGGVLQAASAADQQGAPAVASQTTIVAANSPKGKAPDAAALQGDAGKPAAAHPHEEASAAAPTTHASADTPQITTDPQNAAPKTANDATQQATLAPRAADIAPPPANPAAPATVALQVPAVPLAGVPIEIVSMAQSGKNHFEIRLDPPELGRIEVRLDVDRDGHTTTRLIADRSDTLDLLRRDASGLERALQDAGLKTSDNGLQFSLRDQTAGRQQQNNTPTPGATQIVVQDSALPVNDAVQRNYSRLAGLRGGIDITV